MNIEIAKTVGENLKQARLAKGITQQQLADKTGLSSSAIARWELGQSEPTASAICTLCDFFGVTSDMLLGRSDY